MCFTSKVSITMVYLNRVMGKTWGNVFVVVGCGGCKNSMC